MIYLSLATATMIAIVGSILGVGLVGVAKSRLEILVHLATGALLGITAFDILPEAKAVLLWLPFIGAVIVGYGLLWAIGRFVFAVCPSCAMTHLEGNAVARNGAVTLLAIALGSHCLLDGIAVSTGGMLSERAQMGALLAVGLHKLPEGLALGLLLAGARYRRGLALGIASGIESLTLIGGLIGLILIPTPTPGVVGLVFAIVGGGFVYLVWNAFGGAFSHRVSLARGRSVTIEAAAFLATGALFWIATRT